MKYVTGREKNLKHRKDRVVVAMVSTGLEGSRFPKFRAVAPVVNQQNPLDVTVAVTVTELESAAKAMLAARM
jgi:hypothetical protein